MLLFVAATVTPVQAVDGPPLDFELEDQFRVTHRSSSYQGRVVLLIGSGRKGTKYNGLWGEAIHKTVADHPRYDHLADLPYANLRGVPFFLKGSIRGKFPQEPQRWVLMDWKGEIAKKYGFEAASSNILVFAPDGSLVLSHTGTEVDEDTVEKIATAIRGLLDALP